MGKQHIIELNGKRYDALTGKMVTENKTQPNAHHQLTSQGNNIKSIDGVARHSAAHQPQLQRRPIEKSHTLMRKTVQKPVHHKLHAVATVVKNTPMHAQHVKTPSDIQPKKPTSNSSLISKFSPSTFSVAAQDIMPNKPVPSPDKSLTHRHINPESVVVKPLDQAIASATSHQQPKIKRPRFHSSLAKKLHVSPKIINTAAASLAIVLIAGFFGYQNIPNLKMRLASNRAGLHGTLPAYQPSGFRLNEISYKTGQINISFKSNSDGRNFTVTQEASAWNSDTLREKLKSSGQISSPVEVPDKGKTLFIYEDSNVTWVDGGILYKIEGDSRLNSSQLLNLANSM